MNNERIITYRFAPTLSLSFYPYRSNVCIYIYIYPIVCQFCERASVCTRQLADECVFSSVSLTVAPRCKRKSARTYREAGQVYSSLHTRALRARGSITQIIDRRLCAYARIVSARVNDSSESSLFKNRKVIFRIDRCDAAIVLTEAREQRVSRLYASRGSRAPANVATKKTKESLYVYGGYSNLLNGEVLSVYDVCAGRSTFKKKNLMHIHLFHYFDDSRIRIHINEK